MEHNPFNTSSPPSPLRSHPPLQNKLIWADVEQMKLEVNGNLGIRSSGLINNK